MVKEKQRTSQSRMKKNKKQSINKASEEPCSGMIVEDRRLIISNKMEIFYEPIALLIIFVITVVILFFVLSYSFVAFDSSWYTGIGITVIAFCAVALYFGLSQRTVYVELDKNSGLMTVTRMRYLILSKTITTVPLNEIVRIRQSLDYTSRDIKPMSQLDVKVYIELSGGEKIFLFIESCTSVRSACVSQFLAIPIEKNPVPAWRHFI